MDMVKRAIRDSYWIVLLDIVSVNLAYILALVIRFEIGTNLLKSQERYNQYFSILQRFLPWYTIICLVVFFIFRLYGGIWRYAGINDLNRIVWASVVTCCLHIAGTIALLHNSPIRRMPISYYGFGAALQFLFISAIRFSYRIFITEKRRSDKKPGKALVVGTGDLGMQTTKMLLEGVFYNVCGIIDVEGSSAGKLMNGVPVYDWNEFDELFAKYDITCVFLAEPGIEEELREALKKICEGNGVELRDYSKFYDFASETDQFTGVESIVNGPEHETGARRIPFSPPDIGEAEIAEVVDTLHSGWITTGPRTKLLERRLAAYIETGSTDIDTESEVDRWKERVVCLNSATAAEELNLRVLGVGPGDEVIVPAYTYTASASAAIHCGAKIVFVDIQKDGDPVTHMPEMDYDAMEAAITEKTKAVITVDLGGIVCDYERVFEIVERKRDLFRALDDHSDPLKDLGSRIQKALGRVAVVCDAAHALGASRDFHGERKSVGAIADFTSYSFHAVKNFTTAEGGASTWCLPQSVYDAGVTDAEIYKMYQLLSLHGQSKDALAKTKVGAWEYDVIGPWYKCNMTDIMAAIGLRQLDRYLGLLDRRVQMMRRYDETCDQLGISHMIHHVDGMDSSNHLYLIRIPGINVAQRNKIIERMATRGVATNVHYKPMPMMTAYGNDCSAYPNAFDYYRNLVSLPFHTRLSDEDVEYVCRMLREVVEEMGLQFDAA